MDDKELLRMLNYIHVDMKRLICELVFKAYELESEVQKIRIKLQRVVSAVCDANE